MKAGWEFEPLRRFLQRVRTTNTDSSATLLSLTTSGATVPRGGVDGLGQQPPSESAIPNYPMVALDQLVVNPMWLVGGSIGVSTTSGAVSPAYRVYSISEAVEPRFLHHLVRSSLSRSYYQMFARGETTFDRAVSADDFEGLVFEWPERGEQRRIADFLDDRVSRIDRIIAARREQTTALRAWHGASICEMTETAGHASRPTDVQWHPVVAESWSYPKVSQVFATGSGSTPPSGNLEYYGGAIPWVTTGDVLDAALVTTTKTVTERAISEFSTLVRYPPGTLLVAMYGQGKTKGRVAMLETQACVNQACCAIQGHRSMTEWAFFWFRAHKSAIVELAKGAGQPNLSQEIIRSIRIPLPGESERYRLLSRLRETDKDVAAAVQASESQVQLLTEYKTSLIAAAVTGELDVTTAGSNIPG